MADELKKKQKKVLSIWCRMVPTYFSQKIFFFFNFIYPQKWPFKRRCFSSRLVPQKKIFFLAESARVCFSSLFLQNKYTLNVLIYKYFNFVCTNFLFTIFEEVDKLQKILGRSENLSTNFC